MVIKAKHRPDTCDKSNILTMMEAINGIEHEHLAVVLTHCDLDKSMTMKRAMPFLQTLFKFTKGKMAAPEEKNVFLYKGE